MHFHKNTERGSVMIEVLAILALIGVMAPMLIRQVALRSQEVDNVNMASEIRTIAEGVDAYMQADRSTLESLCPDAAQSEDVVSCSSNVIDKGQLCLFLPNGFCGDDSSSVGILEDYTIAVSGYLLDAEIAPRPIYQAVIIPASRSGDTSILPQGFNLKRASRVASMVGSAGGIVQRSDKSTAYGTAGTWEIALNSGYDLAYDTIIDTFSANTDIRAIYVAVVTSSSYTPEIYTASGADATVALPESVGFGKLHAWNYFSVGQAAPEAGNSCIELLSRNLDPDTGAVQDDVIYSAGTNSCDPLFWVGSATGGSDRSKEGQVYVKNNLYIGRVNNYGTEGRQAVAIESDRENTDEADSDNRLIVYDLTGTERLRLDGSGQIVLTSKDDTTPAGIKISHMEGDLTGLDKTMYINPSEIRSVITADNVPDIEALLPTEQDYQYRLNLTNDGESLLHDIRLGSRRGAKLSDLLPNYISKDVYVITTQGTQNPFVVKVQKPTCPQTYKPALIVTPTRWDSGRVEQIDISHTHELASSDVSNIANQLYVDIPAGSVGGTVDVSASSGSVSLNNMSTQAVNNHYITNDEEDRIIHKRHRFAIVIDQAVSDMDGDSLTTYNTTLSTSDQPRSDANATGTWTVQLGYKEDNQTVSSNSWATNDPVGTSISALAQTYCVYVP